MRAAIVLLICLVASAPGDAGQCSDPALATREARSKSIQAQTDKIAKEINKVEPISPSQEKYFENEKKRLSADPLNYSDNLKRLENNPFYLAYKTREDYSYIRSYLIRAEVAFTVREQETYLFAAYDRYQDMFDSWAE